MKVIALAGLLTCGSKQRSGLPGPQLMGPSGIVWSRYPPTVAGAVTELARWKAAPRSLLTATRVAEPKQVGH